LFRLFLISSRDWLLLETAEGKNTSEE
jgi:hypothetical protein